jgi:hypothetical protein
MCKGFDKPDVRPVYEETPNAIQDVYYDTFEHVGEVWHGETDELLAYICTIDGIEYYFFLSDEAYEEYLTVSLIIFLLFHLTV